MFSAVVAPASPSPPPTPTVCESVRWDNVEFISASLSREWKLEERRQWETARGPGVGEHWMGICLDLLGDLRAPKVNAGTLKGSRCIAMSSVLPATHGHGRGLTGVKLGGGFGVNRWGECQKHRLQAFVFYLSTPQCSVLTPSV